MSACATQTFGVIESVGGDINKIHNNHHAFVSQVNRGYDTVITTTTYSVKYMD